MMSWPHSLKKPKTAEIMLPGRLLTTNGVLTSISNAIPPPRRLSRTGISIFSLCLSKACPCACVVWGGEDRVHDERAPPFDPQMAEVMLPGPLLTTNGAPTSISNARPPTRRLSRTCIAIFSVSPSKACVCACVVRGDEGLVHDVLAPQFEKTKKRQK
jgi:hypothetical protein